MSSESYGKIIGETMGASWDLTEGKKIKALFRAVKEKPELGRLFAEDIRRIHNDQTPRHLAPSPLKTGQTHNIATDDGLQRHAELITGQTVKYFTHFAVGSGTSIPNPANTALDAEIARADMTSDDGWRVSGGTSIIEAGIYDETYPDFTAAECGVFDGDGTDPTTEVMEWRSVYPTSQQVAHTQSVNLVTHIHTMFMIAT